jgi:hypothetical protein
MIMKKVKKCLAILVCTITFISCKKNETTIQQLNMTMNGLEDLGVDFRYEGWIITGGVPVSTGTFTVNGSGQISQNAFYIDKDQMAAATDFVLTIEPYPDPDPAPTSTHVLAGSFASNIANLSIGDPKALGNDFSAATGKYILATPTDGAASNEKSGIWFLDISSGTPMQGLNLPALPAGWVYEGWAVIGGQPVTSGRFTSATMADLSAPYSSNIAPGPPFPGEDYLMNAPAGLTFPADLSGGLAVITVEPEPDNSPKPFSMKPLVGNIPAAAADHVTYNMSLNPVSLPTGVITR